MPKQYRAVRPVKLAGRRRGTGGRLRQAGTGTERPAIPEEYLKPGQLVTSEQASRLGKEELKRLESEGALESRESPDKSEATEQTGEKKQATQTATSSAPKKE